MDTTAVLARTNRALRPFEDALSAAEIKYHLLGHSGFWQQKEIKDALAWLQLVIYPADWALGAAIRSGFWPSKFLPKKPLTDALKDRTDLGKNYWYLLTEERRFLVDPKNMPSLDEFVRFVGSLRRYSNIPAQESVKQVLTALKAWDLYAEQEDIDNSPVDNLTDLVKQAGKFSALKDFLDYARKASAASKGKKGVALGTCHSAKGLEFRTVYLVQCCEGMLPHAKAESLDDERNVLFVGASRAEHKLVLTYSGAVSPFLKDYIK